MAGVQRSDEVRNGSRAPRHRSDAVIEQNVEAIMDLHRAEMQRLSKHQRFIERMASVVSAPSFLIGVLTAIILWIVINLGMRVGGYRPWDHPPFNWLQVSIAILGLALTLVLVVTQHRMGKLEDRNAHLDLQLSLLIDQKVTKVILLLEEMRTDSPILPNRTDPLVEELTVSTDPLSVASRIEERLGTTDGATPLAADGGDGAAKSSELK